MDPALILFLVLLGWVSKSAVEHVKTTYRADRDAKIAQAQQNAAPKGLSAAQKARTASHHAAGWWTREVAGGFPVTRTGWQAGWLAHKLHSLQNKNARNQARRLADSLRDTMKQQDGTEVPPLPQRHPSGTTAPPPDADAKVLPGPWPERPLKAVPDPESDQDDKPEPQPQSQGDQVSDRNNNQSETTYTQDLKFADEEIAELDAEIARLQARRIADRVEQAAQASLDPASMGHLADIADANQQRLKAAQQELDSWQAFRDNLVRVHGPGAEYHSGTPGGGAEKTYLQE